MTEVNELRLQRYEKALELPQFNFMDKVEITEWFYKGFYGKIFDEVDFTPNPEADPNELYTDWVVLSYKLIILDKEEETPEKRVVDTKYLKLVE